MSEKDFKVKCVKAPDEEETPELKEAHDTLIDHGFKPLWVTPAECMELEEKDKGSVYMMDPFGGETFHHLAAIGCRVYGPQCILSCLLMRVEIPRRSVPIYNLAMKGVLVSCTSIEKDKREKLHKQIEYMGGEVIKDFTEDVTHLIAGEVGSKKYTVAGSLGKQIMKPQWVTAVWEIAKYRYAHCTDEQFQRYKCPIFCGLVVTVSGLAQEERKEVKKTIEAEGGKYSGEMKMKECTHLVIKEATGQKFEHARKWKIHIVKPRWVYDSLEKGYCLDETNYRVDKETDDALKTSTPDKERTTIHATHLGDISSISNISAIAGINETTAALQRSQISSVTVSTDPLSGINETSKALHKTRLSTAAETADPQEILNSVDVTHIPGDLFLDGCKFYLSGFRGSGLEKLRKIINAGGGTRFNTINESVTHVLMGERIQADIDLLKSSELRPHVVSAAWLVECYKQEKTVDVDPYLSLELPTVDPTSPKLKGKKKASKPATVVKPVDEDATQNPEDVDDILSQYLPQEKENDTAVEVDQQPDENETMRNEGYDEVDGSIGSQTETDGSGGIFCRKSFVFFGFEESQVEELSAYIRERGGKVVSENRRMVADYGIVPIDGYPVTVTVNEVLTNVWLQVCIEEEKLLPVNQNQLFHPIDMIDNIDELKPLQGCVLSISGFSGTERDCLMHIAMILGASCQEYFVRRASKGLQASTHLLVKEASGTKYEAAKKWKLPAVSKLWLFACARTGKCEEVSDYTIDAVSINKLVKSPTKSNQGKLPEKAEPDPVSRQCEDEPQCSENNDNMQCDEKTRTSPKLRSESSRKDEQYVPVPSSSGEQSQNKPSVMDPMADAKSLIAHDKVRKDSQKENISVDPVAVTNRPQHSRVKELQQNQPKTPKSSSPSKAGIDTPGKFLGPGVTFVPKFNFNAALASLQSPAGESQKHRRRSSVPFGELYEKHVKIAVENSSVKRTETEQDKGNGNQPEEHEQGPLHGVVISVSKKLLLKQTEYNKIVEELGGFFSWKQDDCHTHFIFQGRANDTSKEFRLAREQGKIIVSPHWLYACKDQSKRVDEGQFPHNYNPNLSLSVSGGRTPGRPSRRAARNSVKTNEEEQKREEQSKPELHEEQCKPEHQLEEKNKLKVDKKVKEKVEEQKKIEEEMEVVEQQENEPEQNNPVEHDVGGTLEIREELSKQMEAIMNSSGKTKKLPRKKSKRLDSSGQFNTSGNTSDSGRSRPSSRQYMYQEEKKESGRRTRSGSKGSDNNSAPEPSQSVQVTWDDPTGRLEQEKLAHELHAQSQNTDDYMAGIDLSSSNAQFSELEDPGVQVNEANTSKTRSSSSSSKRKSQEMMRTPTPEAPSLAFPEPRRTSKVMSPQPVEILEDESKKKDKKPPVILVSGMKHDERVDYGALVEQLGGKLLDSQNFDPACTHLVIETPTRNEKFLACVAAGKWVMHKSYFEACRKEGCFVKEECHEWGSEATHKIMLNMNAQSSSLAAAAHRWRQKVKEMKKVDSNCRGAFDGWQVILCTDKGRESNFSRLLKAGGAEVLPHKPPFDSDLSATHAFLELNKVKLSQEDLECLITANVHCLKPEFIVAHLTDDPAPLPNDFCPPDITALKASLPDSVSKKRKSSLAEVNGKRVRRH